MFDVITIGSATRDVFARSGDIKIVKGKEFVTGKGGCFELGSKLNVQEVNFSVGGGAINTAVTFARQGYKVGAIATIGRDPEGQHIRDKSRTHGIHCDFFVEDKNHATSFAFILSLPNGARTVFRHGGASQYLKEEDIPWTELRAKWLYVNHLAGEGDKVLSRLLQEAKNKGAQIAWNPGTTQLESKSALLSLLRYADIFMVNQEEASLITGIPYQKKKQIFKKLNSAVQGIVIMTRGSKGVEVSNGEMLWSSGVLPMKKVVDRTGAGDAFGAGFIAGLMRKPSNMEYAIQLASTNATGVLTEWGANHGLLRKDDSPTKYGKLQIKKTVL